LPHGKLGGESFVKISGHMAS